MPGYGETSVFCEETDIAHRRCIDPELYLLSRFLPSFVSNIGSNCGVRCHKRVAIQTNFKGLECHFLYCVPIMPTVRAACPESLIPHPCPAKPQHQSQAKNACGRHAYRILRRLGIVDMDLGVLLFTGFRGLALKGP